MAAIDIAACSLVAKLCIHVLGDARYGDDYLGILLYNRNILQIIYITILLEHCQQRVAIDNHRLAIGLLTAPLVNLLLRELLVEYLLVVFKDRHKEVFDGVIESRWRLDCRYG